jgi:phosphate transport system permease protein
VSSVIALILSVPLSLGIAVFGRASAEKIGETDFVYGRAAGGDSVGRLRLWGIFVLAPFIRDYLGVFLQNTLGFLPLFQGRLTGIGC